MDCPELKANGYCNYLIASVCSNDPNFKSLPVRNHCKKTCEHPDCHAKPNNGMSLQNFYAVMIDEKSSTQFFKFTNQEYIFRMF